MQSIDARSALADGGTSADGILDCAKRDASKSQLLSIGRSPATSVLCGARSLANDRIYARLAAVLNTACMLPACCAVQAEEEEKVARAASLQAEAAALQQQLG